MSKNIINNTTKGAPIPEVKGVVGTPHLYKYMPVSVGALVNRATLNTTIRSYLKDRGFDWALWVPPKVARFPVGYNPPKAFKNSYYVGKDGRYYALIDGDHRRHMFKLAFPNAATMPVMVVDIGNESYYHKLFYEINFKNRKNANPDETFLHRYLSLEEDQIALARILEYCKVGVQGSPEDNGIVGYTKGPFVRIASFRTAIKLTDENKDAIKNAIEDISKTWDIAPGSLVSGDLLGGFSLLLHYYPAIRTSAKLHDEWASCLETHKNYKMKVRARGWKKAGGDVNNAQGESIALGLLKDFRSFRGGKITSKHKSKLLPKARLEKLLSDKENTSE